MPIYVYSAYGLTIQSTLVLPELRVSRAQNVDVAIRLADASDELLEHNSFPVANTDNEDRLIMRPSPHEYQIMWSGVGRGRVVGGREIVIQPDPGVSERVTRLYILGSALGIILHQRKLFPIHASGVTISETAVGFFGEWGMGKSTMAAAFHQAGYQLIADDILAINMDSIPPVVKPGFLQMKLWPESVEALGQDPSLFSKIHPEAEKRARLIKEEDMVNIDLPLKAMYVLDFGDELKIVPVSKSEALFQIINNWYGTRFGNNFLQPAERISLFQSANKLVKNIPLYRLVRPDNLEALPEIVKLVIQNTNQALPKQAF